MASVQSTTVAAIGVGLDTSRYGHHVSFLRDDLQPATEPITMMETREGYDQLLRVLRSLRRRHPDVVFQIRVVGGINLKQEVEPPQIKQISSRHPIHPNDHALKWIGGCKLLIRKSKSQSLTETVSVRAAFRIPHKVGAFVRRDGAASLCKSAIWCTRSRFE